MDYDKKIRIIEKHLENNKNDYQSAISLMILKSKRIDYEHRQSMIPKLKRIAEIKRGL